MATNQAVAQRTLHPVPAESESTALADLGALGPAVAEIESVVKTCSLATLAGHGNFGEALTLARGMQRLRELITPAMMGEVMQLQNSALGFRTDKSDGGYPMPVVKDCLIEATLRGAHPVGNEFNIISGRPYLTKEFFARAVRQYPGVSNLRLSPGVPQTGANGALVPFTATWIRDGNQERLEMNKRKLADGSEVDERIAVRVNAGMGADAILGKATRKALARIYGQLTGSDYITPEGDVDDPPVRATPNYTAPPPATNGGDSSAADDPNRTPFDEPGEQGSDAAEPDRAYEDMDTNEQIARWSRLFAEATDVSGLRVIGNELSKAEPDTKGEVRAALSPVYAARLRALQGASK